MEEDMDVQVFEVVEIDLDYEFEASRFFDFNREETEAEVREAELWFESAKSYPPSPFVEKLFSLSEGFLENMHVSPKSKGVEVQDEMRKGSVRGLNPYDYMSKTMKNFKSKPSVPRGSTLMKPTASQLAKQNLRSQIAQSRFQKPVTILNALCTTEVQASKRQKLEGGHLCKVGNVMQPSNLVHKVPQKDGVASGTSHSRLRITIPVEPDLMTARRAQRLQPTNTKAMDNVAGRASRFKARPLNRKILEGPTLPSKKTKPLVPEFEVSHLNTMERAVQRTSAVTSTSIFQPAKGFKNGNGNQFNGNKAGTRSNTVVNQNEDVRWAGHSFKARPLNKKIFTCKGDIGVSRNTKRAVTVPKEFEFQTEKRATHYPLTELFSKLSVAPEPNSKCSAQSKLPPPIITPSKGSKENLEGWWCT